MFAIFARKLIEPVGASCNHSKNNSAYIADLYREYKALLFQKAGFYTDNPCAKEDIVQNTVLRLMRKEKHLRTMEPAALVTYMTLAVRSAALNFFRDEHRDSLDALPLPNEEDLECFLLNGDVQLTLEEQMLQGCRDEEVRAAIERLPERDRAVLLGKYFLELDNQELADMLGVTAGTLRTLLCRARGRVLKELRKGDVLHEYERG